MRNALVAVWLLAMTGNALSANSAEPQTVAIGPWQVEASFTEERKFDRCVMTRPANDGIEARFTRDEGGLSLTLTSPRWELEKGVSYPVEFMAGSASWKADAAAASDAVRVPLTDKPFNEALRRANSLGIRTARATITVPLNKSAAAFDRLERCYENNNTAAETNPFSPVKP